MKTRIHLETVHIGPKIEKVYTFAKFDGKFSKILDL